MNGNGSRAARINAAVLADSSTTSYELNITHTFDAPRELVWRAWTDTDMSKQWMGPRSFQTIDLTMTLTPGAEWQRTMEGRVPGMERMACLLQRGKMVEVVPPEKLVFTFSWGERASVGLGESPFKENIVTVLFKEHGGETLMHFTQSPFATEGERNGHTGGWNSSFDKFAEFLQAQQPSRQQDPGEIPTELHLRRTFSAPRQVVFDAWTKPEIVAQWWGPKGFTAPRCEMDARSGGAIHIDLRAPDGTIYPMTGKFLEVYPPMRFHYVSTPLDRDGTALFELWTSVFLDEVPGGTEVVLDVHVTHSRPEGEQHLKGMKQGWSETLDSLGMHLHQKK